MGVAGELAEGGQDRRRHEFGVELGAGQVTILVGDVFDCTRADVGAVTALYDRSIGAGVKAALGDGRRNLVQGRVTAAVNLAWDGTTKLVITAPTEVYIAGQFRKFGSGGSPGDGTVEATDPSGQMLIRGGG